MEGDLKSRIIKLLREDEEFRYAVAGMLGYGELLKRMDENTEAIRSLQEQVAELQKEVRELQRQVRELQKQVYVLQRQVAEHTEAIKSLQEQVAHHGRLIEGLQRELARNTRALTALGARWGLMAEEAFREGMRGVVEEILGGVAERWECFDESGEVYGHPSMVEVDLVVRDGKHVLVEAKSSVSSGDMSELWRIGRLYERKTGVRPELVVVSPYVDRRAREVARRLGIKVYTTLGEA